MRGFSGKIGTYVRKNVRTNGRTNEGESKGPSTPSRDQKWKTIKLQHAILEALYIREIMPGLTTHDELRDYKLIIKV